MATDPNISPTEPWRQFWIFQANPKQYNAKSQLRIGQEVSWYVSRFIDRYQLGDIVYLWIAGEEAGIYGWAEVTSEVFTDDEGKRRLTTVYRGVLDTPLERPFLRSQPQVFDGLSILRNPTGANFRVTVLEAIALNRLIEENNDEAPPDPDQVDDPNATGELYTKAVYALDYRFDNDVKSIIASCLSASQRINGTFFPGLLVQASLMFYVNLLQNKTAPTFALALDDILPLGKMPEAFNFVQDMEFLKPSDLSPDLASGVMVKRNVLNLLASARRFAIKTTNKEQIMARHLIGAILHGASHKIQSYIQSNLLEPYGFDLSQVRDAYINLVEKYWPDDRMDAWHALINEEIIDQLSPEVFSPLLTKLDSDSPDDTSRDFLNIDDDTIAISKVLCARDASPPIAIGLFGEWGSGKTFFMKRIKGHVDSLTKSIRKSEKEDKASNQAYHSKVAQIWFNAWNYQDSKLWASLANHIFSGLKQELKRLNKDSNDEDFYALMEEMDVDRIYEQKLEATSEHLSALRKESTDITSQINILKNENEKLIENEQPEFDSQKVIDELKNVGGNLKEHFGIDLKNDDVSESLKSAYDIKILLEKGARQYRSSRLKNWYQLCVKSPMHVLVFMLILSFISSMVWALIYSDTFKELYAGLSLAGTYAAKKLADWKSGLSKMLGILKKVDKSLLGSNPDISNADKQSFDSNNEKILALERAKDKKSEEINEAKKEYLEVSGKHGESSDETFLNFVFSRADSEDYRSQLGLIHTIRRDFSRLNELLMQQNKDNGKSLPKLDRIILYIDDLDRCEPHIVVDVLQAIHLMLAFPLFMVVVGVDARWLGRSLKNRYSFLRHEKDDANASLSEHAASTHDYLEKIFQIPFWLKPLDGDTANKMIKKLLEAKSDSDVEITDDNIDDGSLDNGKDKNQLDMLTTEGLMDGTNENLSEETEDSETDYLQQQALHRKENVEARESPEDLLISNLISTRSLDMSQPELDFFELLGPIVGRSPRAVKRFINLYRILKASHVKARVAGFSEENGDFKIPLFLLALVCGSPKEVECLFRCFCDAQDQDTVEMVMCNKKALNSFYRPFMNIEEQDKIKELLDELTGAGQLPQCFVDQDEKQIIANIVDIKETILESDGWLALVDALEKTNDEFGHFEMKPIKEWIPDVARFSYREWVE